MNMTFLEFIPIAALILLVAVCIFAIVDRICECKEKCATAQSFAVFSSNGEAKSQKTEEVEE